MRGIVLAAGGGMRLRPLTDRVPKTLLSVDGDRSILELAVSNLAAVGVRDLTVVAGHAAAAIETVVPVLADRYAVDVDVRLNDRFAEANNAYSLWLTRDLWHDAALVVNGDTVHPPSVEEALLAARGDADLLLALDTVKPLADEEMKVVLDGASVLRRISKAVAPGDAAGEYIGVSLVEGGAAPALAAALADTFERDPGQYYEDGYQAFVDGGGRAGVVPIGTVDWVEVDDLADLHRARTLTCRS